ncbi:MAG: sugar ABC transporter permease [Thermotogota bacterium]|nr:sugar ABC transporter permease [Thermotogota bacterium]
MKSGKLLERWWIWLIPMVAILGIFYLYPLLNVFFLSFTNSEIGRNDFVFTFSKYVNVFTNDELWHVLKVTFLFVGFSVVFQLILGLFTAMLINQNQFGATFVKVSMISAWVVPGIITGVVWKIMYSSSNWGVINYFVKLLGFDSIPFLYTPGWALFSVTLANIWRGTGFSGIMQYAALRAIPEQLYEAASIDGANSWQKFWKITLPQLKPMLLINVILITIYTFNTYDSVYALTRGGPGNSTTVLSLITYKSVFKYLDLGTGSVYAILMIGLSATFTIIYSRLMKKEN